MAEPMIEAIVIYLAIGIVGAVWVLAQSSDRKADLLPAIFLALTWPYALMAVLSRMLRIR